MSTLSVSSIQNASAPQANISLNADGSVTLPIYTSNSAPLLFQPGTLWYDTAGPSLVIRNTTNTAWVSVATGGGGTITGVTATAPLASTGGTAPVISATLATAAQAAAGTSNAVLSTPAFSVPKDAANMTGAALLPAGTDAQRAAITSPVAGMQRYNTSLNHEEVYTGASWERLQFVDNTLVFSVEDTSGVSVPTGTFTRVNFPTVVNGASDGWTFSGGLGTFQPLVAGWYFLNCELQINSPVSTSVLRVAIYKNGSIFNPGLNIQASAVKPLGSSVSSLVYANGSTDQFTVYAFQDSGSAKSLDTSSGQCIFQGFLVRRD